MPASSLALLSPRYWPTWLALSLLRVLAPFPYRTLLAIGRVLGRIFRRVPIGSTRTARRNLELCLPELGAQSASASSHGTFESLGIALFETALAWWASDERIRTLAHIEGLRAPRSGARARTGAILLSRALHHARDRRAHSRATRPMNIMYRPTKNALLASS